MYLNCANILKNYNVIIKYIICRHWNKLNNISCIPIHKFWVLSIPGTGSIKMMVPTNSCGGYYLCAINHDHMINTAMISFKKYIS